MPFADTGRGRDTTGIQIGCDAHRERTFTAGFASGLAEAGAAVVINGRGQKNIDGATRRLHEHVPQAKVEGVAADLANAAGVAAFVAPVGAADILVNNLGIFEPKPFAPTRIGSASSRPM